MAAVYDNWERLVQATLRREELRLTALRTPSDLSLATSSSFNFTSPSTRVSSFDFSNLSLVGNSFTYQQILRATNNLSRSNLVEDGNSGDLFYGILEDGTRVIVKKVDISSMEKELSLLTELEFLAKVCHPTFCPLLGHCLGNLNHKFLVYHYIAKKDSSSSLYRKIPNVEGPSTSLDWGSILKAPKLLWLPKVFKGRTVAIELYPGGVFSFQQIKAATKKFNPENKIVEERFGAVYKGELPNGTQVAVKQLSAKSKQGARVLINVIGTIYALQHPNLVKLMGCCVEQNELLLVYEYMENNSLDHALFGPAEVKSRLTWLTRVRICRDVAKGLAFLHEESKLKIIHRDIKPSSIFLDKDFNAKISDFGYAQLNEEEHIGAITKIEGTTLYMAPENYVQGLLTPKVDVYSFGIVTLEIVSGKNIYTGRSKDKSIYLLDTAYEYQQQGNLIDLLDRDLGSDYTYSEALKILNLAMQCVNPSPKQRPSISEVVKVIEGILKVEESKRKRKTASTSNTPPEDDPSIANPVEASFQSTQSGNGGHSVTTISLSSSKEIEVWSTSAD